jgi:DNA-binding response OmpR family regulator
MDGIAAAEAICKTQDVPILFTTSHSGQDIQKRLHAAGPAACILKPFTEKELAIAIEFRLFRHQSERLQQEMNAEIQRLTQRLETLDSQAKPGA